MHGWEDAYILPGVIRPSMRRGPVRLAALAAGLLAAAAPAADPSDRPDASDSFFVGVREICAGGMRLAGSRANLAAEERVAGLFAASGLEHGEMPFDAPSFVPGEKIGRAHV